MQNTENLRPAEAAEYLRVTKRTLSNWRARRMGPPWVRLGGKLIYRRKDLDAWLDSQVIVPVNSDAA